MKVATTIEQSKELANVVPVESADVYWWHYTEHCYMGLMNDGDYTKGDIPAWSLGALLGLIEDEYKIEKTMLDQSLVFTYAIICEDYRTTEHEDLLDAAVEFIIWYKQKYRKEEENDK